MITPEKRKEETHQNKFSAAVRMQSALCGPGRHWVGDPFRHFLDAKNPISASFRAAHTPHCARNQS